MAEFLRTKAMVMLAALLLGLAMPIVEMATAAAQGSSSSQELRRRNPQRSHRANTNRPKANRNQRHNANRSNRDRNRRNEAVRTNRPNANRPNNNRPNANRPNNRPNNNRHDRRNNNRNHRHSDRHRHRGGHVVIVHPRRHWRPGGAIAAGAAIGFIAGASAASWAGPPPQAGWCWYYTNPQRTRGFWDLCPTGWR